MATGKQTEEGLLELIYADGQIAQVRQSLLVDTSGNPVFSSVGVLSDAQPNPAAPLLGAGVMGIAGGAWYRISALGLATDVGGVGGVTGMATAGFALNFDGVVWHYQRTPAVFKALSAVSVASEATIWTPASGKKVRVMGFLLSSSVAGSVTLRDNTAGTIIAVVPCGTAGVGVPSPALGNGILSAAANNVLTATGPAASALSGMVYGTEE
ncbi:MAG: hypothetical protein ACR2PL_11070 [Dehalococcoidia bacterium]